MILVFFTVGLLESVGANVKEPNRRAFDAIFSGVIVGGRHKTGSSPDRISLKTEKAEEEEKYKGGSQEKSPSLAGSEEPTYAFILGI
jgi:hypothetical protein